MFGPFIFFYFIIGLSERLRVSGRVLDLGLKGRRFESTLHLTEDFFWISFDKEELWEWEFLTHFQIGGEFDFSLLFKVARNEGKGEGYRSYPRQTVTSPQRRRSRMPSMNWSLGDTGLRVCQPLRPSWKLALLSITKPRMTTADEPQVSLLQ